MTMFVSLIVGGLVTGSVYGLIAMGFAVVYRATGLLNFAHGEMMLLVAYTAYCVAGTLNAPLPVTIGASVAAGILAGIVFEFVFIRPMAGEPVFSKVMVTIALAGIIRALLALTFGAEPVAMPKLLGNALVRIGSVNLYAAQLAVLGLLVVCCLATWLLFNRSRLGIAMRAAARDESAALLAGIPVKRIHSIAWGLAGLYAALAGIACTLLFNVDPTVSALSLRAFPAAILGGLDSVLGGALGGLVLGVLENLAGGYLGRGMKDVIGFVLIIVILMVKPYGFFGTRKIERV